MTTQSYESTEAGNQLNQEYRCEEKQVIPQLSVVHHGTSMDTNIENIEVSNKYGTSSAMSRNFANMEILVQMVQRVQTNGTNMEILPTCKRVLMMR